MFEKIKTKKNKSFLTVFAIYKTYIINIKEKRIGVFMLFMLLRCGFVTMFVLFCFLIHKIFGAGLFLTCAATVRVFKCQG